MKRRLVIVLFTLFCLLLLIADSRENYSFKENEVISEDVYSFQKNNSSEFVIVGNKNCNACQKFDPIIEKASKKAKRKVYYMNTLNGKNKKFLKNNNVNFTPTILVINKGKIERIEGELDYDETKKIFEK